MSTIFEPSIKSRVMKVIKQHIATAQANYDAGCKVIDESYESDQEALERRRDEQKHNLAEESVNSILRNLI